MFEITPEHIAGLNDEDLRTLIGLLCEAELGEKKFPRSHVTYGGNQNAADGGVDVRVALPAGSFIDGYIPRPSTVFQVKKQDMPRNMISSEMRPDGVPRPIFAELAAAGGAYIMVSSDGSTSDSALGDRRQAMRDAVTDVPNSGALMLDFYDRTRIASWVRGIPGMVIWVRERIGKPLSGWSSYGAWARDPEGVSNDYLLDDTVRLVRPSGEEVGLTAITGLNSIRSELQGGRVVIRLVGLSGMGKTRFVQALFDLRIGENALEPGLAAYCNISDAPDPTPTQVVTELIAAQSKAIVVVDNCPPPMHRSLADLCQRKESTVNLITIEYDIREDQPEGTDVYELQRSSDDLIERLVRRRFKDLNSVDAHKISEYSGGNARVALALASTVERGESVIRLSDEELFSRLFHQRHDFSRSLLKAAQACSLVYSFDIENVAEDASAELYSLGTTIGMKPTELYGHVAELQRRELVQSRSRWRAVLPQAIANRLAGVALQNVPISVLRSTFFQNAPIRLRRSFCRRLGLVPDNVVAKQLVGELISPQGLLGNVGDLDKDGYEMLEHVTPVAPADVLQAIEKNPPSNFDMQFGKLYGLVRQLAYQADLFLRCLALMKRGVFEAGSETLARERTDQYSSLFTICWSGTHASLDQRISAITQLLGSQSPKERSLGVNALESALRASHFRPIVHREFGALRRDYGYWPRTQEEVQHWFSRVLGTAKAFAIEDGELARAVRDVVASSLRDIWTHAGALAAVEEMCAAVRSRCFWSQGWLNVRMIQHYDASGFDSDTRDRLNALEIMLRPSDLRENLKAVVFSGWHHGGLDLIDVSDLDAGSRYEQLEKRARDYGQALATDERLLREISKELVTTQGRTYSFGRGLALASQDPITLWRLLTDTFASAAESDREPGVISGFLSQLSGTNRDLTEQLLDSVAIDSRIVGWLPVFEASAGLSARGIQRLKAALEAGTVPMIRFNAFVGGQATIALSADQFAELVRVVVQFGGFQTALDMVWMRLHHEKDLPTGCDPGTATLGRELLNMFTVTKRNQHQDHVLGELATACLQGPEGAPIAESICLKLRDAIVVGKAHVFDNDDLVVGLFRSQPLVALDTFFSGQLEQGDLGMIVHDLRDLRCNPLSVVRDEDVLAWCTLDQNHRFRLMAALVPISPSLDGEGPRQWSRIAVKLLELSPDPATILAEYADRIQPHSWSGERSAVMEANSALLDEIPFAGNATFREALGRVRAQIRSAIEQERRHELATNRIEERFE